MMKLGAIQAVCGLVLMATQVYELATDSLDDRFLLFLSPVFVIGGVAQMLAASRMKRQAEG